jgi:transposase-like protein
MNQSQRNLIRIARRARTRADQSNCHGLRHVVANQFDLVKTSVKIPPTDDFGHAAPPTKEQITAMPEHTYYAPKDAVGYDEPQPADLTLADHDGRHALGRMISRVEAGRDKPEYSPEIVAHAIDLVAKGNRVQTACNIAGIPHETFMQWIDRYPEFKQAVEAAQSTAEADMLANIARIAQQTTSVTTKRIILPDGSERIEETTTTRSCLDAAKYLIERRRTCEDWTTQPNTSDKPNNNEITVTYVHSYPEPK